MKPIDLAPKRHEAPPWPDFVDAAAVERFERAVRVHRAHVERFRLDPLDGRVDGTWTVTGESGGTYHVDVVDGSGLHDTCTCPDFLFGRLGACKHLAAVHRAIGADATLARKRTALPPAPARPTLTVTSERGLGLVLAGPWTDELVRDLALRRLSRSERAEATDGAELMTGRIPEGVRVVRAAFPTLEHLTRARQIGARREAVLRRAGEGSLGVDVLKRPLFPYQRQGVLHLVANGRALLADDMGLGKTVQTIAACEVLRARGEANRILIVTPASLKHQWASEILAYTGQRAAVVAGGRHGRRTAFASDAPYKILNYELTWKELSRLKDLDADVLVLDEAQRAKNFRTKTAATLKAIPSRFLFVLTGTPLENRLDDLYSLMQLIDPDVLGPLWQFNLAFHRQAGRGKVVGCKNLSKLRERLAPVVLRRRKEEVLTQLPALTSQTRYTGLAPVQVELEQGYRTEASRLMAIAERRQLTPQEQKVLQACLLKARQACNAVELCDPSRGVGSPKLDELEALVSEIVEQGQGKVLIFSEWTEMLRLAARRLDALGVGWAMLHGGVPTDKRPQLIEQFRNDPEQRVLLSTDAGGVGLNLQVANYVIHLDLPWNPARLDQRTSRAHRLGQTRGVFVTYLCAETGIERGIEGTLEGKRAIRSAALDVASEVDELEGQSFSIFLRQLKETFEALEASAGRAVEPAPGREAPDTAARGLAVVPDASVEPAALDTPPIAAVSEGSAAPAEPPTPGAAREPTPDTSAPEPRSADPSPAPRATAPRATNRLRLARLVLENGFAGDAVKAAYDALASSIAGLLGDGAAPPTHPVLVAAMYRELIPSGRLASAAAIALARLHDLTTLEAHGVDVDPALACEVVNEAEGWVGRLGEAS